MDFRSTENSFCSTFREKLEIVESLKFLRLTITGQLQAPPRL